MTIQQMFFYLIIFVMAVMVLVPAVILVFKLWINIKQTKKEINDVKTKIKEAK